MYSFAGLSCLLPYKSIFQKQLGLSEAQNGIIMAIEKVFSLLAPSLLGTVTDKFSAHKLAMLICALLSAFVSFPLYFVPTVSTQVVSTTNHSCQSFSNRSILCDGNAGVFCSNCTNCFITCDSADVYGLTFFLVLVISVLFVLTTVPLSSLIDATTMYVLGSDRFHLYGMQRLWGAVGFGVVGLLAGILVDAYSQAVRSKERDYLLAFICLSMFQIITAVVIFSLNVPTHKQPLFFRTFCMLVRKKQIAHLLFVVFVSGFNLGTRYAFTFWYAEQLPGANSTLFGLAVFFGCFSEVPMFFISGWIVSKFGCRLVLTLGLLASAVSKKIGIAKRKCNVFC